MGVFILIIFAKIPLKLKYLLIQVNLKHYSLKSCYDETNLLIGVLGLILAADFVSV